MKVEYSNRATADLHKVSTDSRRRFGDRVAAEVEARIHKIVEQIRESWRLCVIPTSYFIELLKTQ